MDDWAIRTTGLRELRRELRALGPEWTPQLRQTNKAAAEIVAATGQDNLQAVRRLVPRARYPRPDRQHWADLVRTMRALASQTRAQVALGTKAVPWALGENFGSRTRRQFPPVATPDHALYKAIEQDRPRVLREYGDMLERLTDRAFPD